MEISVGKVLRTKGLDGSLVVTFFSNKILCNSGDILFFEKLSTKYGPYHVVKNEFYKFYSDKKVYILNLKEISSLKEAEVLKSAYIIKNYKFLPENIFIKGDLINSQVVVKNYNNVLGRIVDVIRVKDNYYLLSIKPFNTYEELYIPFIKEIVSFVDLAQKVVYVNSVDGITDII